MPEYLSPGVYVEEIPSAVKPIAGVSTSTACFIGIVPEKLNIPVENPKYDPTGRSQTGEAKLPFKTDTFQFFSDADIKTKSDAVQTATKALSENKDPAKRTGLYNEVLQAEAALDQAELAAKNTEPVLCTNFGEFKRHFGGFSDDGIGASSADISKLAAGSGLQNRLAHAVFGFFNNGGSRCYVMRFATAAELLDAENLEVLEGIDEISLIAAPGITDKKVQESLIDHCEKTKTRFAILDPPELKVDTELNEDNIRVARNSNYAAVYFPRIQVMDFAAELTQPELTKPELASEVKNGEIWIGPSGHIAGIYARVDHERGVHKAPANEVVRGAIDVEFQVSKAIQDGLNPGGVNCLRHVDGGLKVWGARTVGGDANADLKYVNVRRTLIFLEESIDRGTQWVVFEPNDRTLWAKIVRNVSAFLTVVWRDGALFGSTPQEAFYVKCDDETNPPENRDLGRVTTEVGVAIVRPAEFVIFRISQWAGPQGQK
jgi:phage tail sheath protein FI